MRPLRICIDLRVGGEVRYGAAQYALTLANAFCQLTEGEEQYFFLGWPQDLEVLHQFIPDESRILLPQRAPNRIWKRVARKIPGARTTWRKLRGRLAPGLPTSSPDGSVHQIPITDGTIERAGIDVMHFPLQGVFRTCIPSVYQSYDLQHLHYPQFFPDPEYKRRELEYRASCEQAKLIAVMTQWGKQDLIEQYGVPPERVCVVPGAPIVGRQPTSSAVCEVRSRFVLPDAFLFFPAQTWAHKNHIRLLRALAILRDRCGIVLPLVCSGYCNEFFAEIESEIERLGLQEQVRFLGFVTHTEMQSLYRLCRCLVFPSIFEGWGLPVTEALSLGVPVACSQIPPLVEQAGDAGCYFNPDDPQDIARVLLPVWTDESRRELMSRTGKQRSASFTWERTAKLFRAHYRSLSKSKSAITEEDKYLIEHAAGCNAALTGTKLQQREVGH